MQHITVADRVLVGLVAAYFAYALWSGWGEGVIYGDGDMTSTLTNIRPRSYSPPSAS
jgi:hypothetical protein